MRIRLTILTSIVLLAIAYLGISYPAIGEDTSLAQLFPSQGKVVEQSRDFQQAFGTDDGLLICVSDRGADPIFNPACLSLIERLTRQMESNAELVETVVSLTNLQDFRVQKTTLPFLAPLYFPLPTGFYVPQPYARLSSAQKEILRQDPFLQTGLLSADRRTAAIWILLKPELKLHPDYLPRVETLAQQVTAGEGADLSAQITGFPLLQSATHRLLWRDGIRFFVLAVLLSILLPLAMRISWQAILALLLSMLPVAALWLAYHRLLGRNFHLFSNLVLPFFLITTVPLLMHLQQALRRGEEIRLTWQVCTLSVFTTALGFATLSVSPLRPLAHLGLEVPLVVLSSFGFSALFLWLLGGSPRPSQPTSPSSSPGRRLLRWPILLIGLFLAMPWFLLAERRVEILSDFLGYLPTDHPRVRDVRLAQAAFKSKSHLEIIVHLPANTAKTQLQQPETYLLMKEFEEAIERCASAQIVQIISPVTLLSALNRKLCAAEGKQPSRADFRLTPEAAAFAIRYFAIPYLGLFAASEMPQKKDAAGGVFEAYRHHLRQIFSSRGDHIRFGCRLLSAHPEEVLALKARLEKELLPLYCRRFEAVEIYITGYTVLISETARAIQITQYRSLIGGALTMALLMLVLVRSPGLWLLAVLTNLFSLCGFFSAMVWLGLSLNLYTIVLVAAILGLIVDDTLHFLLHYKRYRQQENASGSSAPSLALTKTVQQVRPAIVLSSLSLAMGFGVFWGSPMPVYRDFAILSQLGILLALFWDSVMLPLLVQGWEKIQGKS